MTIFRALLVLPLMSLAVAQSSPTCCPKSPTTGKEAALWHKLETEVREIDARLDAVMGVAIEDLSNGRTLFLNPEDRKSTRLNSSHLVISYAVFCLKKKK